MRIKKTSQYIQGGAGLPSYFTDEINTGMKWIDGKSIYRKCFTINYPSGSTTLDVSTNILNLQDVVKLESIVRRVYANSSQYELGSYYSDTSSSRVLYNNQNNVIGIRTTTTSRDYIYYVILEYTKTTD